MNLSMNPLPWIVKNSIYNCHAKGVLSMLLNDKVRMFSFSARMGKSLRENLTGDVVGFHPNHCDITLIPLVGHINNIVATERANPTTIPGDAPCPKWSFISPIKNPGMDKNNCFKQIGSSFLNLCNTYLYKGNVYQMKANTLHTIHISSAKASWLVIEGDEDPNYKPFFYSRATPRFDSKMYIPATEKQVVAAIGNLKS